MSLLSNIQDKLYGYQKVAGVQLVWTSDGEDWHVTVLEKKKNALTFGEKSTFIESIESLQELIDTSIPIVLVLEGKGILHKQLDTLPEEVSDIPNAVLPGGKAEDFCFQVVSQENNHWVSLARKEAVVQVVKQLKELDFSVVQLCLGAFSIRYLLPLLDPIPSHLNTGYQSLEISANEITNLIRNPEIFPSTYYLEEEPIPNICLPSAGAAFQTLLGIPHEIHQLELIKEEAEQYRYAHWFKLFGWIGLIGTFVILLINFIIFSSLDSKIRKQELELVYHQRQLNQLDSLRSAYQERQQFFSQNNLLEASKISFYADEIGASIPNGIQLTGLDIFPSTATDQQKRDDIYLFDKSTIRIQGISNKSPILNEWIKTLKGLEWTKEVKVLPYSEKGGVGEFELEIKI